MKRSDVQSMSYKSAKVTWLISYSRLSDLYNQLISSLLVNKFPFGFIPFSEFYWRYLSQHEIHFFALNFVAIHFFAINVSRKNQLIQLLVGGPKSDFTLSSYDYMIIPFLHWGHKQIKFLSIIITCQSLRAVLHLFLAVSKSLFAHETDEVLGGMR